MDSIGKSARRPQQRVVTKTEVSDHLDRFIQQLSDHARFSLSGVLVSGYSGAGKTLLVEKYLQRFETNHPVLIARHYQRHQNIPYFGFKYCISDYLSKIYNKSGKAHLQEFSAQLKQYLGEGFPLLVDYVPELSLIFGMQVPFSVRSGVTIQNQLYPLFKRLFEFLSDFYQHPVLLFTDDLQWIDAPGINLLKYLLQHLPHEKLVWIGACREPQSKTSLVGQMIEELRVENIGVENMVLKGLTRDDVKFFMESALGAKCQDAFVDLCHELTEGNQSRLRALLENFRVEDLLRLDGDVIHGDVATIRARFEGQHMERELLDKFQQLSADCKRVVSIMACLGRFDKRLIADWLQGDEQRLRIVLEEASASGILENYEQDIRFSRMDVGELIYGELAEHEKQDLHYEIASLFYARGLDRLNGTDLILMASGFNESIDRVKAEGIQQRVAQLNYEAAKILQHDKALDRARYFLNMSAELLKECPRELVTEQIWLVYMDRARIEYSLGEYDLAEIHLDYLLLRITDPLKRSKVFELKMTINNHLARYQKAVWILRESLGELGLALPMEEQPLLEEVERLKVILAQREAYAVVGETDYVLNAEHSEAVLRMLYVGGMSLHHTSDVLMTWAALQIIISADQERPSAVKAIGYVSYGRMLIISGDIRKGHELGSKGLALNQSLDDISLRCRVFGVYAFYIQPWVRAFAESDALLLTAKAAGEKSGDLIGVYILKTHQLNLHVISGLPLKDLQWDFEESYPGLELTYYITHYQKSLIKYLTGETSVFSIPRQNPSSLAGRLTIQEEKFYRNYVWARYYFLFGNYELAVRTADEAHANRKLQEGSPLVPANLLVWYLSVTQNWFRYPEAKQQELDVRVHEVLGQFFFWKYYAAHNYEAAWCLMKAEYARIHNDVSGAAEYYRNSFEKAGANMYHRALTAELWAKFLLSGNSANQEGRSLLLVSVDAYSDWSALAKGRQLMQQFEAVLHERKNAARIMDIETIQYELSGDMEVGSLVSKLMVLLLRMSGSTQVVVELVEETGERAYYDELSLLQRAGQSPVVPTSMILMALKSQSVVVVNDLKAEQSLRNIDDLHERGVQSFLILPVTIGGHLAMVIYLESVFEKQWYTEERVKSVRIAANQGAVMIENARIHEHSVKLNEHLREEIIEKERLSSMIEVQKDAHLSALMQTQDNERKRIAADLHDSLGSLLSSVRLRFNGLQYEYVQRVPERAHGFDESLKLLDEAIDELRRISHNMVPVSLGRFGLYAALQTFLEQVRASGALAVDLQILGLDARLPEELEVRVYRICQELVQNVIKHAHATTVRIQIIRHLDSLNLLVEDNGVGLSKAAMSRGFGFSTIQSNVDVFKGTFDIESQPGKGCLVLIDLPLTRER